MKFLDDGLSAPKDFQLIEADGIDISDYFNISTIAQPIKQMGELSLEILLKRISGEMVPNQSILPIELIVRGSTK